MNNRKIKALVILLLIALLATAFCLYRAIRTINEFKHITPQYSIQDGKYILNLPSGKTAAVSFAETAVSVYPSKCTTHEDAVYITAFIKGIAEKEGKPNSRRTIDMIGEYRLHAILSAIGYKPQETDTADLDYEKDRRWYVNLASRLLGVVGI